MSTPHILVCMDLVDDLFLVAYESGGFEDDSVRGALDDLLSYMEHVTSDRKMSAEFRRLREIVTRVDLSLALPFWGILKNKYSL